MQVVEVYKASSPIEARAVSDILHEAGIKCRVVGENLEAAFGVSAAWDMAKIGVVVSEDDKALARDIIEKWAASQLQRCRAAPKQILQYGMRWLLINFTIIALVFALYPALGPHWRSVASPAFFFILIGNLMVYAYVHKQRRRSS